MKRRREAIPKRRTNRCKGPTGFGHSCPNTRNKKIMAMEEWKGCVSWTRVLNHTSSMNRQISTTYESVHGISFAILTKCLVNFKTFEGK